MPRRSGRLFAARLPNDRTKEIGVALEKISKNRTPAAGRHYLMKGKLSTHVLDIQNGGPAAGLSVALWRLEQGERVLLKDVVTNFEGRTDEPLLDSSEMQAGEYELVFQVGAYFGTEPEKVIS